MSTEASKRISVTLSMAENEEIEGAAMQRGVAVAQIIRERLAAWQPQPSLSFQLPAAQMVHSETGMLFFKEFMERLGNLEQQSVEIQTLVQQILKEDIPGSNAVELPRFLSRMERLEGILDGIQVLVERIAREVTSNLEEEEAVIQQIQTTLEQFLEENQ